MEKARENCFEWLSGSRYVVATVSTQALVAKMRALAKKMPKDVKIIVENKDGSLMAKMPLAYLHICIPEEKKTKASKGCDGQMNIFDFL